MKLETFERAEVLTKQLYEIGTKLQYWKKNQQASLTAHQKALETSVQLRALLHENHLSEESEFVDAISGLLVAWLEKKYAQLEKEFAEL